MARGYNTDPINVLIDDLSQLVFFIDGENQPLFYIERKNIPLDITIDNISVNNVLGIGGVITGYALDYVNNSITIDKIEMTGKYINYVENGQTDDWYNDAQTFSDNVVIHNIDIDERFEWINDNQNESMLDRMITSLPFNLGIATTEYPFDFQKNNTIYSDIYGLTGTINTATTVIKNGVWYVRYDVDLISVMNYDPSDVVDMSQNLFSQDLDVESISDTVVFDYPITKPFYYFGD